MSIKRNTIQRSLVLEAVNKLRCHATADEIYQTVAQKHPNISKGTVYRNLNQLAQNGEIRKLEVPGGADRFDHQRHDHYHIRCLKCGRVFDVDMDHMEDLEERIKGPQGFTFLGHDLIFKGLCPDCREKTAPKRDENR